MNTEHPAVHDHTPHMKYWGGVKAKAEECVKHILENGNYRVNLRDAIGKDAIESPEDWDSLLTFCKRNGAVCHDLNRLSRASTTWLQAFHELEYKRLYP